MSLLGVMVELTVCHSWILAALQARRKGRGPKQAFPCPMLTLQVPSCSLLLLPEQVAHDKLSGDGVLLCLLDIATLPLGPCTLWLRECLRHPLYSSSYQSAREFKKRRRSADRHLKITAN